MTPDTPAKLKSMAKALSRSDVSRETLDQAILLLEESATKLSRILEERRILRKALLQILERVIGSGSLDLKPLADIAKEALRLW